MSDISLEAELRSTIGATQQGLASNPDTGSPWSLGICKVLAIDYEAFTVCLRTINGTSDQFDRTPVPLVFPGGGARHFMGAMPQVGDFCICGWIAQDSGGVAGKVGTRIPVILGWTPNGVWTGRDWVMTADLAPDEHDLGIPRKQSEVGAAYTRTRRKLRHLQPGNIMASSAQGSDFVLDEGVLISNRRANEIRLRDQDQALVIRTLQQFHAMAGMRTYGGMVQRDATLLAKAVVSDGLYWDSPRQFSEDGKPLFAGSLDTNPSGDLPYSEGLPALTGFPAGKLLPARILGRETSADGKTLKAPMFGLQANLDPYDFLNHGLFIDQSGTVIVTPSIPHDSGSTYGGKRIFRVASLGPNDKNIQDATSSLSSQSFTEYRVEIAHTSDGTLPVTEQTDGLDVDRLPNSTPKKGSSTEVNPNSPFIKIVHGTVVGNDPYSVHGRSQYGLPLSPVISPDSGSLISSLGLDLGEQAAVLLQLSPVTQESTPDTLWAVKKNGQVRAFVSGPADKDSIELATTGNVVVASGGTLALKATKGLILDPGTGNAESNTAFGVHSSTGAITIHGGGRLRGADNAQSVAAGNGSDSSPSVLISGAGISVQSEDFASLKATNVADVSASTTSISGTQSVNISGGQKTNISGESVTLSSSGKHTVSIGGPLQANPANGALRDTIVTSFVPGTVDRYQIPMIGDRVEEIQTGNHSTTIQVGNMTYRTAVGSASLQAGANQFTLQSASGLNLQVPNGNMVLNTSGYASIVANGAIMLNSSGGIATLRGGSSVVLSSPGGKIGGIVSGSDIDPLTGLPLASLGMGSPKHILSV